MFSSTEVISRNHAVTPELKCVLKRSASPSGQPASQSAVLLDKMPVSKISHRDRGMKRSPIAKNQPFNG